MPDAVIRVAGLEVSYGREPVIEGVSFSVAPGEIVSLLGVSGSGKSTLLRSAAGFVTPSQGTIHIGEQLVSDGASILVPPEKRGLGMMFQDYALFPYLTVAQNVGFGIEGQAGASERVAELLALVGIDSLADRKPGTLSGGQQQRVALVRALAPRPALLLLDEPFANLDGPLRREIGHEVRRILKREGTAAILVTHDRHEALGLSDRVGVITRQPNQDVARLTQLDAPASVYARPSSPEVASLTGPAFLVNARRQGDEMISALGPVHYTGPDCEQATVVIRPHQLQFIEDPDGQCTITDIAFMGPEIRHTAESQSAEFWFDTLTESFTSGTRGRLQLSGTVHGWPAE